MVVMARVAAAVITVACHVRVARAFSGCAFVRGDVPSCHNIRLQSTSDDNDNSMERGENKILERLEESDPIHRRRRRNMEHWGVERHRSPPYFPATFDEVADEAFRAITGTLCGLQRPDPNVASNAMHKSVLDYRPTHPKWASKRRWADGDDGGVTKKRARKNEREAPARMGIEIDGAACLSDQSDDEGRAMRILSLQIAWRLCSSPWEDGESDGERSAKPRSVAVYFNTVQQSLLASRELGRWKNEEGLDRISIRCLGHDSLPQNMIKQKGREDEQATMGIVLVVKPSDYDSDSLVPVHGLDKRQSHQPTIQADVVQKLQSLLFQSSASNIPVAVLSPRLTELSPLQSMANDYKRTGPSGFEQSGFQRSSTYGGIEPPVGPTSWLLRDLVPPVYVWAGCAKTVGERVRSRRSVAALFCRRRHDAESGGGETNSHHSDDGDTYAYYSRVALMQSAMEAGHSWHMFVARESLKPRHASHDHANMTERDVLYHYIGSSSSSRGRPSSRIMNDVFEEFCEVSHTE